jgi:hypothetical protein
MVGSGGAGGIGGGGTRGDTKYFAITARTELVIPARNAIAVKAGQTIESIPLASI